MIAKVRPTFRMLGLGIAVVVGGSLVAYIAASAILWLVFTVFG